MKKEGNGVDSGALPTWALQEGQDGSGVGGGKFSAGFTDNEMNVKHLGRGVEQAVRYSCSFPEGPAVLSPTAVFPVPT